MTDFDDELSYVGPPSPMPSMAEFAKTDEGKQAWNPGGWMAKRKGCTCPRLDNHEGKGRPTSHAFAVDTTAFYVDVEDNYCFIISRSCLLHASTTNYRPAQRSDPSELPNRE